MTVANELILASSSPYRRSLLGRLGLEFRTVSPDIDESPLADETPRQLVLRLSAAKAERVAANTSGALVIASDQVAELDNIILTKPGNRDRAREQLRALSGRAIRFLTGICVLNTETGRMQSDCVTMTASFRELAEAEIERYLEREQPWDCAGAFKSEALGIALLRSMEGPDPTALIGLPLIRLAEMLRQEGLPIP
ncbi:MAG: nucleoside triphosphate pyrophosphatase [Gammaproteobacteria bacterium]